MDIGKALETATVNETLFVWLTLHGNLCLALRHPSNIGASRGYTVAFVEKLGRLLVERGLMTQEELAFAEQVEREMEAETGDIPGGAGGRIHSKLPRP